MTNEFDIIEHPLVQLWFKDQAKKEPLCLIALTQGNIDFLKKTWGKPTGLTKRFNFWRRDYLGIVIYVYTDYVSTFYKIQYLGNKETFVLDKKIGSYLTGFLNKLSKDFLV